MLQITFLLYTWFKYAYPLVPFFLTYRSSWIHFKTRTYSFFFSLQRQRIENNVKHLQCYLHERTDRGWVPSWAFLFQGVTCFPSLQNAVFFLMKPKWSALLPCNFLDRVSCCLCQKRTTLHYLFNRPENYLFKNLSHCHV